MASLKIGALVPARIGSKRLPKKNIKPLGGKPMLCWTVDVLLEADVFDDITVSTESDEVADVVRAHYGSRVHVLMRPDDLAGDDSNLKGVVYHYLDARPDIQWYGLFMPTYPFRKVERLHEAVNAIYSGFAWKVISVQAFENCSLDYYFPVENGVRKFFSLQPFFSCNTTSAYIFHNRHCQENMWQQYGLTLTERVYKLYASIVECVDVDTSEDFEIASHVADGAHLIPSKPLKTRYGSWTIITPNETDVQGLIRHIGDENLDNITSPILFLDRARPALSTFRLWDSHRRAYWVDEQAVRYLDSEKVKQTGNNAYYPVHYQHSVHYRFLRNAHQNIPYVWPIPEYTDFMGVLEGSITWGPKKIIPFERCFFIDNIKAEPWFSPGILPVKGYSA